MEMFQVHPIICWPWSRPYCGSHPAHSRSTARQLSGPVRCGYGSDFLVPVYHPHGTVTCVDHAFLHRVSNLTTVSPVYRENSLGLAVVRPRLYACHPPQTPIAKICRQQTQTGGEQKGRTGQDRRDRHGEHRRLWAAWQMISSITV